MSANITTHTLDVEGRGDFLVSCINGAPDTTTLVIEVTDDDDHTFNIALGPTAAQSLWEHLNEYLALT